MMLWAAIKPAAGGMAPQSAPLPGHGPIRDRPPPGRRHPGLALQELHHRGLPSPSEPVCDKHGLARSGGTAHLITTPHHHDSQRLDRLLDDIVQDLGAVTAPASAAMSAA